VTFGGNAAIDGLYGNYDGTGGAVNLTAGKTLLIHQYSDSQFGGTFAGTTAGLSFDSQYPTTSGWLKLTGASTYTGPTNILSGGAILAANGNAFGASTNPVTLNGGKLGVATGVTVSNPITLTSGKIVGLGTYQAPAGGGFDIKSGIVLSPGFGLGGKLTFDGSLLSTSTLILNGGGTYDWHIVDFANATTGYDSVAVNGTVSIAATTSTPFTVNIISVAPTGGQGLASNFDPTHPYSWNILTATNITGYTSPSQFALGLNFTNPNSGLFSLGLDTSHTNLVLTFNPVPEPSTYALLLAGLGLTWFATRRRRCYPR
jgi:autotransporter-associated beta strand protein